MRLAGAVVGAALAAGCAAAPTPEEQALERYERANALFEQRLYREAIPHYEFALSVRDRLKDAYHRLSRCYEAVGEEGRALDVLERARRVDRYDETTLRNLGRLYARRGLVDEAIRAWKDLLEVRPGDEAIRAEIARLEGRRAPR